MKNILFPTDFSENSWNAIAYALKLFKDAPCNFYVLHVDPLSRSGVESNSFVMPSKRLNTDPRNHLADIFGRIKTSTTNKEHHFIALHEFGNLIDIIRKTVSDKKINLIVMGTKGASGIKETILGSNTGNVMTKVPCNLLMIPEKAEQCIPKEIAFPTDYHIFYSHSILEAISNMLRITKAKLRVVNVSKPGVQLNDTQNENMIYLQDYLLELYEDLHSIHHLKNEKAKRAIEQFVVRENIDMVLMVAKNLNFLQQLLFDTSIKKISFQTSIPLLVMHE
ncbi:universal stress protein [Arenibacter troitsensis]|uniref:Nucleotide-binding universal stress protein, UspA family n=1 Tax=Arenibacter troitsensis TaxID=188872 RepID=A0A1X7IUT0_9FLAO|nr:universal stress protein [Arenibacter troitsensis]SMG18539.1 Nucleotide-binding universal stress protein, UspA family [Arenibacter troitsensis]